MSIPLILTSPGGGGGSATPGGNTGDIQYNNGGVLGGEALVPLANGGTNADLSASGGTTAVLAQDALHAITARNLVAADIPSLDAAKIATGQIALARGGTNADLSASGGTTAVLAQDASHIVTARNLVAADIPNLAASKITSGQIALAQGGTNTDLSGTGGASKFLKQASAGAAITVVQPAFTDLTGTIAAAQIASASIDLTAKVTGVLPTANGGTEVVASGACYLLPQGTPWVPNTANYDTQPAAANSIRGQQIDVTQKVTITTASVQQPLALANLTLSSVANASAGSTTYTGTITGGGSNAFAGFSFVITGFVTGANNGTFLCTASTTTTLVLANASGAAETHAATAAYVKPKFYVGILDMTGVVLWQATFTMAAAAGVVDGVLSSAGYVLLPGSYYYVWGCDTKPTGAGLLLLLATSSTASQMDLRNAHIKACWLNAGSISAGAIQNVTISGVTLNSAAVTAPFCALFP